MSDIQQDDQDAIRDTLFRFLSSKADEAALRQGIDLDEGFDPGIWQQLCEMGLSAIAVSEERDGIGGGAIDTAMVCEELGKSLLPVPYIESCVIATFLLEAASSDPKAKEILSKVTAGEIMVAIGGGADFVPLRDSRHTLTLGDDGTLTGEVSLVLHGASASHVLLGVDRDDKSEVFIVDRESAVATEAQAANDPLLRPAKLSFERAPALRLHGLDRDTIEGARLRAVAALAAFQAGATRSIFEVTIEYLQTRYQFGRPIGSFQALKHMAADLLMEVESATSAARAASLAIDKKDSSAARLVALAGFICTDAFRTVAAQSIQMHGGIAYTCEHVAHLYWRRSRAMLSMFGDSDAHREDYLQIWENAA